MKIKLLTLIVLTILLTACNKVDEELVSAEIEDLEKMQAMRMDPSEMEVEKYCMDNGGFYEKWGDGKEYCMFEGYGCDPGEFYYGRCGIGI